MRSWPIKAKMEHKKKLKEPKRYQAACILFIVTRIMTLEKKETGRNKAKRNSSLICRIDGEMDDKCPGADETDGEILKASEIDNERLEYS